jgi:hypothetical protein
MSVDMSPRTGPGEDRALRDQRARCYDASMTDKSRPNEQPGREARSDRADKAATAIPPAPDKSKAGKQAKKAIKDDLASGE